jgi:carbon-monoxide dehydrogenase medium subunit
MYPTSFAYHRPSTLAEAAALLQAEPEARILAGGHSLLPAMKLRLSTPAALVDLAAVPGLSGIAAAGDGSSLTIGALTPHGEVATSPLVESSCPLLAETATHIGDLQVRNRGTLGGSLAHADPGADYPTALLALEATVETGGAQSRQIPIADFFRGLLATDLRHDEILTAVRVPTYGAGTGGAYVKHRHPASSFAVVGVAALVTVTGGVCSRVRLAVGGATVNAVRARAAEEALVGQPPGAEAFRAAAAKVASAVERPLGDLYASGEFRLHLAAVLAARALATAAARAAGG